MKVALYARYSTDLQDKTSIDGQVANCEALAAREGLNIVARFRDEGRSGNDDQRDGYQSMLDAIKRGDFVGIVCDETSRITRNQAELHRLTAELRFRDQFLITCDGIDTRSESSDLVLSVKAAIDQMEGRKIGYRTYRSLRERHKAGHSAGGRIYGYTSEKDGDYRRRVIDPEQAEIVKEIFERYAAGEGAKSIARDLNERGIPSPGSFWKNRARRAKGWVSNTITGSHAHAGGIVRNPIYKGLHTWNKRKGKKVPGTAQRIQRRRPDSEWIEVQDESLRVVSDSLWNRAQVRIEAARQKMHPNQRRGRPARYLLSGLLVCGDCGGSYVMANDRNYRCSSHTNGRDSLCEQKRIISRQRIEDKLLSEVKAELLAPENLKAMTKRAQARLRQVAQPDKALLRQEAEQVGHELKNLVDSIAKLGGSDALLARVSELEAEKARIESQLQRATKPPRIVPNVEKTVRARIETLEEIPRDHSNPAMTDKARAAVRDLIGQVTVHEEGERVFGEVELGQAYIIHGAEERT